MRARFTLRRVGPDAVIVDRETGRYTAPYQVTACRRIVAEMNAWHRDGYEHPNATDCRYQGSLPCEY